jgi:hypothetical protein
LAACARRTRGKARVGKGGKGRERERARARASSKGTQREREREREREEKGTKKKKNGAPAMRVPATMLMVNRKLIFYAILVNNGGNYMLETGSTG